MFKITQTLTQNANWDKEDICLVCVLNLLEMNVKDACDRKILHTEFFKVQYIIIIQAILSQKSMKKIIVTDEKIFRVYKAFDRER